MLEPVSPREEDYLKAIYILSHGQNTPVVPGDLVAHLGVSSAAVSRMTQRLAEAHLVRRTAYQGVTLTDQGQQHALRVIRFHRLAEVFLVDRLGYDWADVEDTLEKLEHAFTEELANRLEAMLDYPNACPHGDPIPDAGLVIHRVRERPLTTLPVGHEALVSRVTGDRAMLKYLKQEGLIPGRGLRLLARAEVGGLITIELEGETRHLSPLVAGAVFVRPPG
jgi:DtxR family transcriptional regulator, Mn-dependent transcriptional regulator